MKNLIEALRHIVLALLSALYGLIAGGSAIVFASIGGLYLSAFFQKHSFWDVTESIAGFIPYVGDLLQVWGIFEIIKERGWQGFGAMCLVIMYILFAFAVLLGICLGILFLLVRITKSYHVAHKVAVFNWILFVVCGVAVCVAVPFQTVRETLSAMPVSILPAIYYVVMIIAMVSMIWDYRVLLRDPYGIITDLIAPEEPDTNDNKT